MDLNPLADMAERAKKQQLENRLNKIQNDIDSLRGDVMRKSDFVTLQTVGSDKVSINPAYISYVKEDGANAHIYMNDGSMIEVSGSRNQILNLIEGKKTIG